MVYKHLPGHEVNETNMGMALYLENHYWNQFETVVANAIAKAFKG